MTAEFIIAVRGEKPENLRRTVEAASKQAPVHVVYDGDETPEIDGIKADTSQPWTDPRGCGQARHYGIMDSKADVVILTDGHMTFPDGMVDRWISYLQQNRKALLCARTRPITTAFEFEEPGKLYTGAFLGYRYSVALNPTTDYHAVGAKWNPENTQPGPVGCVMGACYAMRREWYLKIGQPLSILDEWGGDEEVLSLGTLFMGGKVVCRPDIVGHLFGAPRTNRTDSPDHIERRIASRFAVLNAIPMMDTERLDLAEWIRKKSRNYDSILSRITAERAAASLALRDLWARGKRTWANLCESGVVRRLTVDEDREAMGFRPARPAASGDAAQDQTPRVVVPVYREIPAPPRPAPGDQCDRCDSVGQMTAAPGWYGMRVCRRCGHKQQVRR